jgi:hypothetical protein
MAVQDVTVTYTTVLLQLLPLNTSTTFQVGYNANNMLNDLALKAKGSYNMSPTTI